MTQPPDQGRYGTFSVPLLGRLLGMRGNPVLNDTLAAYVLKKTINFQNFIEIGAGPGALSESLLKKFQHYIVLDKSGFALDVSRRLSPGITPIHEDIFDFFSTQRFDAVLSMGLAEHFQDRDLHRLINKHIEIARDDGSIFICVRAYDPNDREHRAMPPEALAGHDWNPRCEFLIASWLNSHKIRFEKTYFDRIPGKSGFGRFIRAVNMVGYYLFKINVERFLRKDKGKFVAFHISKKDINASCYFEQS